MHTTTLTMALNSDTTLSVRFDTGAALFEARVDADALLATSDMADAFRLGAAPPGVVRALTHTMAAVVFAGDVGPELRGALTRSDERALLLELDPRLAPWPWELALGEAACTVRVAGKPSSQGATTLRATLAFAGAGQSRGDAVIAATRALGRKHAVDISTLPHTTGPSLRRSLEQGALLVHLEAQAEDDALQLDDGAVPVDRLGASALTWLVVLWAPRLAPTAPLKVRGQGAAVVVSLQAPLDLASKGVFIREFYRCLSAGASVAGAAHRARRALAAALGSEAGLWAAPVVHTAPPSGESPPPALGAFPPPLTDAAPAPTQEAPSPADARPARWGMSWPQTCAVFIYDTLRSLSDLSSPSEAEARVEVLRALGGQLTLAESAPRADSPEERTRWLADRLLASLTHEDAPLEARLGIEAAHPAHRVAEAYGISPDLVLRLCAALERGVPIALTGLDWPRRADLVRDVAALAFGYGALPIPNGDAALWFDELVALHWVREQLDPLDLVPAALPGRAPLIGRSTDGTFCVHRGVWAVLEPRNASQLDEALDLVAATARGARLSRGHDQRPRRLPVPQDFRVVLSVDALPAGWPATFAHVQA